MQFKKGKLSEKKLLQLYTNILRPRLFEEKMLLLLRQGRISKWFSGIGQEAIAVGATIAMEDEEYILPMHRNLGVFTSREVPLLKLMLQFQGKADGFTKGRDRSFHFGSSEHKIWGMISHLGPQMGIACGLALGSVLDGKPNATLVFSGEGGTSEGDFHEALNVAAVWDLPVIFLIENNGYGLSTPVSEQFKCEQLADRGKGYGMKALTIDGNNILDVYKTVRKLASDMRKDPKPVLLECMTFRMRGHEEASGTKYVPEELMQEWAEKDPVDHFERFMLDEGIIDEQLAEKIRSQIKTEIDEAVNESMEVESLEAVLDNEINDRFKSFDLEESQPESQTNDKRLVDAISDGLKESMKRYSNMVIMGQDVAEYGGVFKITEGFVEEFGRERVRNTPLCESAIIGTALGLSAKGYKSVVEMQFADFVSSGFNQIVNNLAKIYYRWGQNADVVVRMPTGAGVGAGPFHSQSNEAWFTHTPGLKVVYPSNPYDAKGLLIASIEDPNPVMFFEHKALYRSIHEEVPEGYYNLPIGKAAIARKGEDISIITYGMGVHWAKQTIEETGIDAEIVDLRTLNPLDYETVFKSVRKTGKAIVLHEDVTTGGIGGDIVAEITANCFEQLDGPVIRVGSLDTPVPFASALEEQFLPVERFKEELERLLQY